MVGTSDHWSQSITKIPCVKVMSRSLQHSESCHLLMERPAHQYVQVLQLTSFYFISFHFFLVGECAYLSQNHTSYWRTKSCWLVMIRFHEHKDVNELFTVTHADVYRGERRNKERKKINLPPVFNKLNQSKIQQSSPARTKTGQEMFPIVTTESRGILTIIKKQVYIVSDGPWSKQSRSTTPLCRAQRWGGGESGPLTGTCSSAIVTIAVSMHLKCVTVKVKLSVRFY